MSHRISSISFLLAASLSLGLGCSQPKIAAFSGSASHPSSVSARSERKAPTMGQCADSDANEPKNFDVETIGDTAVLRLYADAFTELSPKERVFAYYLSRVAALGDSIVYDQRSRYGLTIKNLCEELSLHSSVLDPTLRSKIEEFVKLVFLNKGIYDGWSQRKIIPSFSLQELHAAALLVKNHGAAFSGIKTDSDLKKWIGSLAPILFDPAFEPIGVTKSPAPGKDLITGSAATYYDGLQYRDLATYHETSALNSRISKRGTRIVENVYRAGRTLAPSVPKGLYAEQLSQMIDALRKAKDFAADSQKVAIDQLITFFETGEASAFHDFNVAWVGDDSRVDSILGFIETYGDPRGVHAEYEGLVFVKDQTRSSLMSKLAGFAPEFEQTMPWLAQYKRDTFRAPVATAVQVVALSGGAMPVTPAGINLPNEQAIRQKQGSKSFFLSSVDDAASSIYSKAIVSEFLYDVSTIAEYKRCLPFVQSAKVALHEVIGHGSGKVSPNLTRDPKELLKDYGSALEEARAELVALYAVFNPKVIEAGLIPDNKCAQIMAEYYPLAFQLRLRLIPSGETIEQDHVRAQSLIVRYAMNKGAVKQVERDGKKFLVVPDIAQWRAAVGELLAEVMRIKAEGDYEKGKALIENYGRRLDPGLRDDSVRRAKAVGLPTHFAFLAPKLKPLKNDKGEIVDATLVDSLGIIQSALVDAGKAELP